MYLVRDYDSGQESNLREHHMMAGLGAKNSQKMDAESDLNIIRFK